MNANPTLPDDDVILAHWHSGFDTLEIARIFHAPESYIYSRLIRIRAPKTDEARRTA